MNCLSDKIAGIIRVTSFLIITVHLMLGCSSGHQGINTSEKGIAVLHASEVRSMDNGAKWSRCFRMQDGNIYFNDSLMSRDGGKTLIPQTDLDLNEINGAPERAVYTSGRMLYALDGPTEYISPGVYSGRSWRSEDNLKSIKAEKPLFYIPEGAAPIKNIKEWYGIFVYRTIIMMPDSTWLMTMYGNFKSDTIIPFDTDAAKETKYMQRTFIVSSDDKGATWHYVSTVAAPRAGDPVGEGLVEPAITMLQDGRLLCVMRSGHHFPLYASWSSDNGKTWNDPLYTGLDRACDPCLITLHDGTVALSWGRRFPEGWSSLSNEGDKGRFKYPGEGYTNLALSKDGGLTWINNKIIKNSGSCYSTIFETEPGLIFMQSDQWYCTISLMEYQGKK
ncbi:MAG: exo-alpha-sialidase [Bacteroidales bacterium]|nr:exo-alpha-sialidase [Bacteroidales bacterium]